MTIPRIAGLKTPEAFRAAIDGCGADIAFDPTVATGPDAPLARRFEHDGGTVGNRFAILPMEGWDGTTEGAPTDLTRRRWANFGASGAKLIWGGEAVAVRPDGRANPNQLVMADANLAAIEGLRAAIVAEHRSRYGRDDDLFIGLQLTHSGRYSRPNHPKRLEPITLYPHPALERRLGPDERPRLLDDGEIGRLVDDFVVAAVRAKAAGFGFVDIKHCHAYLGHEFLSAIDRPGDYGGSLANRTRFLREVAAGIRSEAPGLEVGVRLSVVDTRPFRAGADGRGEPEPIGDDGYRHAFGADPADGLAPEIDAASEFLTIAGSIGIRWICTTVGSPYYNPHLLRPAAFPPSDGYLPPEDPLVGVGRHIVLTRELKARHPGMIFVGSGYSYLQEWLPNVAQRSIADGAVDFVGVGRMVLSYPEMPADVLAGRPLARKRICRTFSDCTTGPRNGLISGCYPLDPAYRDRPEREAIAAIKRATAARLGAGPG